MQKVARDQKSADRDDMRRIAAGDGNNDLNISELEDGATISTSGPVEMDAEQLMVLTRRLAGWFGHVVVHPTEWRDKLQQAIEKVCEEHEARCLDDETDRRVVINALLKALVPCL